MNRIAPPATNPFATRHVKPGAMPFIFPAGESLDGLVARLADNEWQGEIVGPHGSGKSTLLASLIDRIERTGHKVVVYRLHEGDRYLPEQPTNIRTILTGTLVVVDGYEQLPYLRKWMLRSLCNLRGFGLLVTAHARTGLPLLWQTAVDLATFKQIVNQLLAADAAQPTPLEPDDIAAAHAAHPMNLREALFKLYDTVESRRKNL
jgi:hypothetical protein